MSEEIFSTSASEAPRSALNVRRLGVGLAFVGLLGVVAWLLSERNHRTFSVERDQNQLVVMRGMMLPFGSKPYHPEDRALADAYAPIPVGSDSTGDLLNRTFHERDDLDQELFKALSSWIAARLAADTPEKLAEAVIYLRRVEKLSALSADQRRQLADLKAEAAYYEGKAKLDEALDGLRDALDKLETATDAKSRHAREASALLLQIAEPARATLRAGRVAPATAALVGSVVEAPFVAKEPVAAPPVKEPAPSPPAPKAAEPPKAAEAKPN